MSSHHSHPAIFNLGFRVFFAGAGVFSFISIACWLVIYASLNGALSIGSVLAFFEFKTISPFQWHAHEMIYGYSLAVISGFLLTAVKNWTGIQTIHGYPLALLFGLWALARILWLAGDQYIFIAAFFDIFFIVCLCFAVASPIIATKQWRQMAILSKLFLLGLGNLAFYLEAFSYLEGGIQLAIYGGLYLVIGLILTIGRRIIPLFVENGVPYEVSLFNSKWLDMTSLFGFLGFFITEVFLSIDNLSIMFAGLMFIITSIRIIGWYTPGIWAKPLLWCFYLALFFIDLGFLLFVLAHLLDISPFLSVHAFAVGAIGIITMGMMARVSTGHTGRSLKNIPKTLLLALLILSAGAVVRVLLPLIAPDFSPIWVLLSGLLWLVSFGLFIFTFLPYWTQARVDQKYG
tara:strand:+ start:3244 stop:4452 length:1209 start_codon:yes stop_codon:yes gene_type:complete